MFLFSFSVMAKLFKKLYIYIYNEPLHVYNFFYIFWLFSQIRVDLHTVEFLEQMVWQTVRPLFYRQITFPQKLYWFIWPLTTYETIKLTCSGASCVINLKSFCQCNDLKGPLKFCFDLNFKLPVSLSLSFFEF